MFEIPIYPDEQDIAEAIRNSCVVSSLSEVVQVDPFEVSTEIKSISRIVEPKNDDLYYLTSLLFSSSWNGNDELFLPSEIWKSRNTAKDKPVNYEHTAEVIGHMTHSYVIDDKSNKINDNTKFEDLPELIHVINQAVLYRKWNDQDKEAKVNTLIAEIKDGKWFVSVECLFPDFDYVTKNKNGQLKIINRNKETSYLTKYLRTFNGQGIYNGEQIGRVPRNFIISAKGLVKRPANKISVIFANQVDFNKLNSVKSSVYKSNEHKEVIKMDNEKLLAETQAALKLLREDYAKLQASITESEITKIKNQFAEANKLAEAKEQEVQVLKASIQDLNTKNADLAKAHDEVIKVKDTIQKEFDKIVTDSKLQHRLNAAKVELKMDEAQAKSYVESLDKLSDEAFAQFITFQKSFISTNSSTVVKTEVQIDKTQPIEPTKDAPVIVTAPDAKATEIAKFEKLQASISEYINKNHVEVGVNKFKPQEKVK